MAFPGIIAFDSHDIEVLSCRLLLKIQSMQNQWLRDTSLGLLSNVTVSVATPSSHLLRTIQLAVS